MNRRPSLPALIAVLAGLWLGGCTSMLSRLQSVGSQPPLSPIEDPSKSAPPVTMPVPRPIAEDLQPNSLWRPGARAFFADQRAAKVGDLLTVTINIADTASLENTTKRERTSSENAALPQFLGYNVANVVKRLPGLNQNADPSNLVEMTSSTKNTGSGSVERKETVTLRIAATVTQVLPNGNLVVAGTQEVRVNNEARVLQVAGVIRPQDLRSTNEIPHDRLAEARISYGGRGQITDVQQPRWGQQFFDILFPF